MASDTKSFADLVKAAPAAPAAGTVSLTGTLSQSSEAGKFVLTMQDGSALTLETAAVKGHSVLGTSVGQTIVRVDVDSAKLPSRPSDPEPVPWSTTFTNPDIDHPFTIPVRDYTLAWLDHGTPYWLDHTAFYRDHPYPPIPNPYPDPYGGGSPVQAPVSTLAVQRPGAATPFKGPYDTGWPDTTTAWWADHPHSKWWLDKNPDDDNGTTNPGTRFPD